jgi:hypothetical protein
MAALCIGQRTAEVVLQRGPVAFAPELIFARLTESD